MQRIIKFISTNKILILLFLLSTLSFFRMLRPGVYSTQDFHLFRLYQFEKCLLDFQLPCRWAPDAGLGYGEPIFNFYGQVSYLAGEFFRLIGFSLIDSLKAVFAVSLAGSAIAMYFLAKKIWKNEFAGLISAVLYLFAPYRAVDVWVRGAFPEAVSFILFPLILLSIENKKFFTFTFLVAALVTTHNLSALMFLPVLVVWLILRKYWEGFIGGVVSLFISSYYLLPLIFESKFINIRNTTLGYFDFHNHFATSFELFISNFWGYGASVWGPKDDLSLAIGYLQWIVPVSVFVFLLVKVMSKRTNIVKNLEFFVLFVLGWFFLFMTHNKSTPIWETFSFLHYIQFPWRFLGMVVFCFSLAAGSISSFNVGKKFLFSIVVVAATIFLNTAFFREDLWFKVNDSYYTTGSEWDRQRTASIGDYWPIFGPIPTNSAKESSEYWRLVSKKSNYFKFETKFDQSSELVLPVNYFPGWVAKVDGVDTPIVPSKEEGRIKLEVPSGNRVVELLFLNTTVRKLGNFISLLTIIVVMLFMYKRNE